MADAMLYGANPVSAAGWKPIVLMKGIRHARTVANLSGLQL